MAVIADLMARLGVDITDFQAGMSKVDSIMKNAQGASTALLAGVAVAAAGMAAFGVKSIIAAGQLEQTTVAFTTMLGSAEKSTALLKELQTFAATTPFEFTEITAASKKLLAFGVNAEDITSTLRSLGDVSSGIGAPIGEIAELYGKAKTQGRLFAEDINQLTGRGIPIIGELAKQFNVSESEVRGLVESGQVGFPNLQLAFENMTAAGGQFGGLMDAQSKTLPGMWSNLMDALGQSSVVLGQELIKTFDLKDKLAGVISGLSEITALLQSEGLMGALDKIFNEKTQLAIVAITGAIVAALIPAIWGAVVAFGAAVIALAPFIVIGTAVSALAYTIYKNWEPISAFFTNIWTVISTTATSAWTAITDFFTTTWGNISTGITTAWNAIPVFFIGLWNSIKNTFMDVINGIVTFVTTTFSKQTNDVYVIFLALERIFIGVWEIIKNVFSGALLLIIDLVTGNFTQLKLDAANIFDSLKTYFSDIWGNIGLIFTRALDLITTTLTPVWNGITTTVTNAWNGIIDFFTGAWSSLTTAITGGFDASITFIAGLPYTLYNLGVDAFNGLIYGVSDILSGLWWAVSSGFNDAISFITNLPGQAWQWGADIIGGIVQGIKDAAWAVGNAVSGVAQTIRNFLHFSVPDEGPLVDFQSWMPDFMGGLAEGITNSKYLVTNAMKGLSTDMSIGVNTNVVSGNVGGSTGGNIGGNAGSGRPQSINVIVELDSRTLLKALGQPLADTIRLKASAIF